MIGILPATTDLGPGRQAFSRGLQTRDKVLTTLRFVAGHTAPVQVVFDYYLEMSSAISPELRTAHKAATRLVAELGNP
ncbi:hypothetical protein ACH4SK_30735 [Streptomyces inhibens]|uniref:hypothetical protein n=1 Tax=Streptomyces inhibens TaxID=2293571 RepID=UPI0037967021